MEVSASNKPQAKRISADWLVTGGLLLLSAVPILAGAVRLTELVGGAQITESNARFFASPIPVIVHIIGASLYSLLGAFQFSRSMRRNQPMRHRTIGRILIPAGLAVSLSGLWMTQFYPWPPPDGELLYAIRLFFGTAMTLSLVVGYIAARRRSFMWHGIWMTRAYAIGLAAGTQVFTHVPYLLLFGVPDELARALLMLAGWVINLAVAEWVIQKRLGAQVSRPAH